MQEWFTGENPNNISYLYYTGELIPYIESITPSVIQKTGTTNISIKGQNFIPTNDVSIPPSVLSIGGASSVVYSVISPTEISAIVITNNASGSLPVVVANGDRHSNIWGDKSIAILSDPYFQNVILFLKGDGINGSTDITDSSPASRIISLYGNIAISTIQAKYGSSIRFDANGKYLSCAYSSDFNWFIEDFTIESWIYPTSQNTTFPNIIGLMTPNGGTNYWSFGLNNTGALLFYYWNGSMNNLVAGTASLNQWHHIAFVHKKNTGVYLFLNGVRQGPFLVSNPVFADIPISIGMVNNVSFSGYIDCLRITKGVARYLENFNHESATALNT